MEILRSGCEAAAGLVPERSSPPWSVLKETKRPRPLMIHFSDGSDDLVSVDLLANCREAASPTCTADINTWLAGISVTKSAYCVDTGTVQADSPLHAFSASNHRVVRRSAGFVPEPVPPDTLTAELAVRPILMARLNRHLCMPYSRPGYLVPFMVRRPAVILRLPAKSVKVTLWGRAAAAGAVWFEPQALCTGACCAGDMPLSQTFFQAIYSTIYLTWTLGCLRGSSVGFQDFFNSLGLLACLIGSCVSHASTAAWLLRLWFALLSHWAVPFTAEAILVPLPFWCCVPASVWPSLWHMSLPGGP